MVNKIKSALDSELSVKITDATPMKYREGGDKGEDRPGHVRAASSVARIAEYIVIVQDDANFLALIEEDLEHVESIALPAGPRGNRVFGKARGNAGEKLDLEGCVSVPGNNGEQLLSMGSGSSENREWVLRVELGNGEGHDIDLIEADLFYSYLRTEKEFCGSGLNVEGVIFDGEETVMLFNRGNSKLKNDFEPVDATAELSWPELEKHLENPDKVDPPKLTNIIQYDLGELDSVRLTFSDGTHIGSDIVYSASAEAPGDSDHIAGSSVGIINDDTARWSEVIDLDGTAFEGKIEGLIVDKDDQYRIYFVIDDDQADQPSEIFEAKLEGPWYQ